MEEIRDQSTQSLWMSVERNLPQSCQPTKTSSREWTMIDISKPPSLKEAHKTWTKRTSPSLRYAAPIGWCFYPSCTSPKTRPILNKAKLTCPQIALDVSTRNALAWDLCLYQADRSVAAQAVNIESGLILPLYFDSIYSRQPSATDS